MNSTAMDMESPAATSPSGRTRGTATFIGVAACFILSGFAALLYQTAWMRQFSILFGTSELAIVSVLAAYMGGLALGSAIAGRLAHRVKRPVLVYGVLEAGIAIGALLVPFGLDLANRLLQVFLGGQPAPPQGDNLSYSLFYVAATFAVILIPTTLMGATLPLLTRYAVARESDIGQRVGLLYALNTLGAVAGTLFAAFNLLPAAGLAATVRVGVVVNLVVFVIAAIVARSASARSPVVAEAPGKAALDAAAPVAEARNAWERRAPWVLTLMLVSGGISFTYEVLWTRLVSHLLGGSVQAFATMLASFLVGITVGSGVASRFARTRRGSLMGLAICQLGTALLATGIYLSLDQFAGMAKDLSDEGGLTLQSKALLCMGILLPATLCIGATFPFALRALARNEGEAGLAAGRVYAWNTTGAVIGALCAGFLLVPELGYAGTATFGAAINVLLALGALWILGNTKTAVAFGAIGLLTATPLLRGAPDKLLFASPLPPVPGSENGRKVFQAVGRSASVLMLEQNGRFYLRTNGLPEAWIETKGSPLIAASAAYWLSMIPVLARPSAKEMLMIGFGGGVALEAVPPSIEKVDCVELEPEVINANRALSGKRLVDPLADPRIEIIFNDARGALNLTAKRYDVIVSQPSHPWTAGGSHLFTSEFAALMKEHLNPEGVFLQWMNTEFVDADLLKSMGATLLEHYAHVRLYCIYPEVLMFVASEGPLNIEEQIKRTGEPLKSHPEWYSRKRLDMAEDLLVHLAFEEEGLRKLCKDAPVITDDANLIAMRSESQMEGWLYRERFNELMRGSDPLIDTQSATNRALGSELDWIRISKYLLGVGDLERAQRIAFRDSNLARRYLALALLAQNKNDVPTAIKHLERAVQEDPEDQDVLYSLVSLYSTQPEMAAETEQYRTRLTGAERATLDAHGFARLGQFDQVAALEPELAKARPGQIVYPIAMQLRALWRCVTTENAVAHANEAIEILDLIRLHTDVEYRLRMRAAKTAQRPAMWLETADDLVEYMTKHPRSPEARAAAAAALTEVRDALAPAEADTREADIRDHIQAWLEGAGAAAGN